MPISSLSPRRLLAWLCHSRLRCITAVLCIFSASYWLLIASDLYMSEARLIVQNTSPKAAVGLDLASLIAGNDSVNRSDQLLLREYLRSMDMAEKLDQQVQLRQHFSQRGDWLTRLWGGVKASPERLHAYYLRRVEVSYDEFSGVLIIRSQAFQPSQAHAMTAQLLTEGERFMNGLAHSIAQDQVRFLESQVGGLQSQAQASRQAMLEFQEQKGLISPEAAAQTLANIIANLQVQLTDLEAQRSAMQAYLVPDHPNIVLVEQRIRAVEKQMAQEQSKLAAPGGQTLNRTAEAYSQLENKAKFDTDMYQTALKALEQGRLEATRTLKKISVLQTANLPQDALAPRRLYNTAAWVISLLLLAGIIQLLVAIVRDHQE